MEGRFETIAQNSRQERTCYLHLLRYSNCKRILLGGLEQHPEHRLSAEYVGPRRLR